MCVCVRVVLCMRLRACACVIAYAHAGAYDRECVRGCVRSRVLSLSHTLTRKQINIHTCTHLRGLTHSLFSSSLPPPPPAPLHTHTHARARARAPARPRVCARTHTRPHTDKPCNYALVLVDCEIAKTSHANKKHKFNDRKLVRNKKQVRLKEHASLDSTWGWKSYRGKRKYARKQKHPLLEYVCMQAPLCSPRHFL